MATTEMIFARIEHFGEHVFKSLGLRTLWRAAVAKVPASQAWPSGFRTPGAPVESAGRAVELRNAKKIDKK